MPVVVQQKAISNKYFGDIQFHLAWLGFFHGRMKIKAHKNDGRNERIERGEEERIKLRFLSVKLMTFKIRR